MIKFKNLKHFGEFIEECEYIWNSLANKKYSNWELYEFGENGIIFFSEEYGRCGDIIDTNYFTITWEEIMSEFRLREKEFAKYKECFEDDWEYYLQLKPFEID